jgi:uncharacterized protein (TIGR02246 family)
MRATTPELMYEVLAAAFNAADLEQVLTLYEADAALVAQPGQVIAGTDQIRAAVEGFLALNGHYVVELRDVVRAGDLALASARWSLAAAGADGQPIALTGISADVLRRQADGAWRYVIDQPWGDQMTAL